MQYSNENGVSWLVKRLAIILPPINHEPKTMNQNAIIKNNPARLIKQKQRATKTPNTKTARKTNKYNAFIMAKDF